MKHQDFWLNEKEDKEFMKEAEKRRMTGYALRKILATEFLRYKKLLSEVLGDTKAVGVCVFFWTLCYSLIVGTVIMVF